MEDIAKKGQICILDIEMEVRLTCFSLKNAALRVGNGYKPTDMSRSEFNANQTLYKQGVKQVANHPTFPRPRFLFLAPPSLEILEQRLRGRQTDSEEAVQKRLKQAKVEMDFAETGGIHDKIVVNDDLDKAYEEVRGFIVGQ